MYELNTITFNISEIYRGPPHFLPFETLFILNLAQLLSHDVSCYRFPYHLTPPPICTIMPLESPLTFSLRLGKSVSCQTLVKR